MLSLTGEPVFGNVATFPTLCLLKSNPKKETYRCISHIVAVYIYTSLWLGTGSLPSCTVVVFWDLLLAEIGAATVLPKTGSPVRPTITESDVVLWGCGLSVQLLYNSEQDRPMTNH